MLKVISIKPSKVNLVAFSKNNIIKKLDSNSKISLIKTLVDKILKNSKIFDFIISYLFLKLLTSFNQNNHVYISINMIYMLAYLVLYVKRIAILTRA